MFCPAGLPRECFQAGRCVAPGHGAAIAADLAGFKKLTKKKETIATASRLQRAAGKNPYPVNSPRVARLFGGHSSDSAAWHWPQRVAVLDAARTPVTHQSGMYSIARLADVGNTLKSVQQRHLVVLDKLDDMDTATCDVETAKLFLAIVALGKPVIGMKQWLSVQSSPHLHARLHRPALLSKALLFVDPAFGAKHRGVRQILEQISKLPRSKWKLVDRAADATAAPISSIRAVHDFARAVRRLHEKGGVTCRFTSRLSMSR